MTMPIATSVVAVSVIAPPVVTAPIVTTSVISVPIVSISEAESEQERGPAVIPVRIVAIWIAIRVVAIWIRVSVIVINGRGGRIIRRQLVIDLSRLRRLLVDLRRLRRRSHAFGLLAINNDGLSNTLLCRIDGPRERSGDRADGRA
jgi:hypothetical protein